MMAWDLKRVESCLNKLWAYVRGENHIIKAHPKNPRKGADLATHFQTKILPEIAKDVVESLLNKQIHGDAIDEDVVIRELSVRINMEFVKFGVAMIPLQGQ